MSLACLISPVLHQLTSHQSFHLGEAVTSYILWSGWCCVLQVMLGLDAPCQLGSKSIGLKELLQALIAHISHVINYQVMKLKC